MWQANEARVRCAFAWAAFALVTGCGGGGGGGSTADPQAPTSVKLGIGGDSAIELNGLVSFSATGTSGAGLTYAWSFGDGTSSAEAAPQHSYGKAGVYQVTLSVTTAAGVTTQAVHTMAVNDRRHVSGLLCSGADGGGWCWQYPWPTGNQIQDFTFFDASTGWTAGWNGEFMKTTDGGSTWQRFDSGSSYVVTHVGFSDAQHGWGLSWDGTVTRTTDGGATWSNAQVLGFEDHGGWLRVVSPEVILVAENYAGAATTTDGGNTWTPMAMLPNLSDAQGRLWQARQGEVLVSSDHGLTVRQALSVPSLPRLNTAGALLQAQVTGAEPDQPVVTWETSDGGVTWTSFEAVGLDSSRFLPRHYVNELQGWVSGYAGIYRTTDGGRHWFWATAPEGSWREVSLDANSTPDVIVRQRGEDLVGHYSLDAGATWTPMAMPFSYSFTLKRTAGAWHALSNGVLKVSTDGMATWRMLAGASRTYKAFWFFDDLRGVAVSDAGETWTTADGGRDWQPPGPGQRLAITNQGRVQMRFSRPEIGWALDVEGQRLWVTVDGGKNWDLKPMGDMNVIAATLLKDRFGYVQVKEGDGGPYVVYAVGGDNYIWKRRGSTTYPFKRMAWLDENRGVGVTANGDIEVSLDGGITWSAQPSDGFSGGLTNVVTTPGGDYWATGGSLPRRSTDAGLTWTKVGPGLYVEVCTFVDAKLGWASDNAGAIHVTRDGGNTWTKQPGLLRASLSTLQFVNGRVGWGVTREGALIATGTGGD